MSNTVLLVVLSFVVVNVLCVGQHQGFVDLQIEQQLTKLLLVAVDSLALKHDADPQQLCNFAVADVRARAKANKYQIPLRFIQRRA